MNESDAYLSFLLGMWFHTRDGWGLPSVDEALASLKAGGYWTKIEREEIVCRLAAKGQIGDSRETKREMYDAPTKVGFFVPRLDATIFYDVPRGAVE